MPTLTLLDSLDNLKEIWEEGLLWEEILPTHSNYTQPYGQDLLLRHPGGVLQYIYGSLPR